MYLKFRKEDTTLINVNRLIINGLMYHKDNEEKKGSAKNPHKSKENLSAISVTQFSIIPEELVVLVQ